MASRIKRPVMHTTGRSTRAQSVLFHARPRRFPLRNAPFRWKRNVGMLSWKISLSRSVSTCYGKNFCVNIFSVDAHLRSHRLAIRVIPDHLVRKKKGRKEGKGTIYIYRIERIGKLLIQRLEIVGMRIETHFWKKKHTHARAHTRLIIRNHCTVSKLLKQLVYFVTIIVERKKS